jgi:TRAP-type C4-dicarboxylate transport system permease small subunit
MFSRAAKYIDKVVSYPSDLLSAMAMVAIVVTMLAVVADVLGRWIFRSPIRGAYDIVTMAFAIIVWGPMALAAFKGSHIAMTFLLDKFPRLPRLVFQLIIALMTSVMLGIVSWRLAAYGITIAGHAMQTGTTGILGIPISPFVYFAAFGCALLALLYLARVPETVGKIRREPEAVEKIQKEPETVEKIEKMKGSGI